MTSIYYQHLIKTSPPWFKINTINSLKLFLNKFHFLITFYLHREKRKKKFNNFRNCRFRLDDRAFDSWKKGPTVFDESSFSRTKITDESIHSCRNLTTHEISRRRKPFLAKIFSVFFPWQVMDHWTRVTSCRNWLSVTIWYLLVMNSKGESAVLAAVVN